MEAIFGSGGGSDGRRAPGGADGGCTTEVPLLAAGAGSDLAVDGGGGESGSLAPLTAGSNVAGEVTTPTFPQFVGGVLLKPIDRGGAHRGGGGGIPRLTQRVLRLCRHYTLADRLSRCLHAPRRFAVKLLIEGNLRLIKGL